MHIVRDITKLVEIKADRCIIDSISIDYAVACLMSAQIQRNVFIRINYILKHICAVIILRRTNYLWKGQDIILTILTYGYFACVFRNGDMRL